MAFKRWHTRDDSTNAEAHGVTSWIMLSSIMHASRDRGRLAGEGDLIDVQEPLVSQEPRGGAYLRTP